MLSHKQEVAALVRLLINSTANYVAPRIHNVKNKAAYIKAMKRCLDVCSIDDLSYMSTEILKIKKEAPRRFLPRPELFSDVKGSYMMGIDHCGDVVESIYQRFEGGYSHADEFFVRNILENLNRD